MNAGEKPRRGAQSIRLRRALFQVHLWSGLTLALYVVLMSLSGTILIYRTELSREFTRPVQIAPGPGPRMSLDEVKQAAARAYPGYEVQRAVDGSPDQPVNVWLALHAEQIQRLFNPYTGKDMGNSLRLGYRFVQWLDYLHGNLLYGLPGRLINGVGGLLVIFLGMTGIVVWWPGISEWRRSLTIDWKTGRRRLTWTLHRTLGVWFVAFVFMWGISGIYLVVPNGFHALVDFLSPVDPSKEGSRFGDQVLYWLARLHFGRFAGLPGKIVWTVLGLVPIAMVVTGTLMWWNRVLRPRLWPRATAAQAGAQRQPPGDLDRTTATLR